MYLPNIGLSFDAFQVAEISIPANTAQTKFPFPDQPYLRPANAIIKAIEIYVPATITNSPVTGTALSTVAELKKTALTLYGGKYTDGNRIAIKEGNQVIQQIPTLRINSSSGAAGDSYNQNIFVLDSLSIDWTKSFIEYTTAPANGSAAAMVFGIYFDWINSVK